MLIFLFTPVSLNDVLSVGVVPFLLSFLATMTRIFLQAIRFYYFVRKFIGKSVSSFWKIIFARLAGEFVTQTTPSYIGGELVRIAFLTKSGVPAGRAAWVTTMEIIADVFVGTILAFIAGFIAISNGSILIGLIIVTIATPTFGFWFFIMIYSAKKNIHLPSFSLKLAKKFISEQKAQRGINSVNKALDDLCIMSRENFGSFKSVKIFSVGIAITLVAFIFHGLSFLVLTHSVDTYIGLFLSFMATSSSTILGTLPVTIGGSGLAEWGLWGYINHLNDISQIGNIVHDNDQLNVIIAWRIASYYIPLIIMWIALMRLALRTNYSKSNSSTFTALDNRAD
jgi:glycosyltransferase 2 family protein